MKNGGKSGSGRDLTSDEAELWDVVTRNDKRWKDVKTSPLKTQEKENKFAEKITDRQLPEIKTPKKTQLPYLHAGDVVGVDRSTADKLRRGKIKIDATLDMHGMTRDEAINELLGFISACRQSKKRCALIITGKGSRILNGSLPQWLNLEEIRQHIIMFDYAQPKHGGNGAYYVLLRRKTIK